MNREEKQAWLDSLIEGQEVLIQNRVQELVVKVERITKTRRFTTERGIKFNSDGTEYGAGHRGWQIGSWSIEPITDEYWKRLEKKEIVYRLGGVKWDALSYEKLKKINEILSDER